MPQLLDKAFYAQPGVENIDQEVTKLDAEAHQLTLADGREITFDKLLLATGGRPVWPEISGNQLAGVHVLRDIYHAPHAPPPSCCR